MKKTYSVAMISVATSLLLTHGAYGSMIVGPATGLFVTSSIVNTPFPGVEGTSSGNTLTLFEDWTSLPSSSWFASFNIVPNSNNTKITTEYLVTKIILNDSGLDWANFFVSGRLGPLNFNIDYFMPPTITGSLSAPNPLQIDPDGFHWSGLNVPNTNAITVKFYMDVCADCAGGSNIFQQATAPEPVPLVLTGGGLVCLGLWRRRRTHGSR
jgi:hypothetical protein